MFQRLFCDWFPFREPRGSLGSKMALHGKQFKRAVPYNSGSQGWNEALADRREVAVPGVGTNPGAGSVPAPLKGVTGNRWEPVPGFHVMGGRPMMRYRFNVRLRAGRAMVTYMGCFASDAEAVKKAEAFAAACDRGGRAGLCR